MSQLGLGKAREKMFSIVELARSVADKLGMDISFTELALHNLLSIMDNGGTIEIQVYRDLGKAFVCVDTLPISESDVPLCREVGLDTTIKEADEIAKRLVEEKIEDIMYDFITSIKLDAEIAFERMKKVRESVEKDIVRLEQLVIEFVGGENV